MKWLVLIPLGCCLLEFYSANLYADSLTTQQRLTQLNQRTVLLEKKLKQLKADIKKLKNNQSPEPVHLYGIPITTSPYLGTRSKYTGTELIANIPKANNDLRLLQQIQRLKDVYHQMGWLLPNHPVVNFSGEIQVIAFPLQARDFNGQHFSKFDVPDAELDTAVIFNPWMLGFMTINFDNSANSRFYMDRGFLTIGNLEKSPLYLTAGQFYVPFGQYSNGLIDNPLTKILGQTRERAVNLGYTNDNWDIALYHFHHQQFGGNINYSYKNTNWHGNIAAGYISNLAESISMQKTFTATQRVPGFDTYGTIGTEDINLWVEYVTAVSAFSRNNMTFNNHGAKPNALDIELNYTPSFTNKPTMLVVGYDQSQEALALLLPQKSYFTALNFSLWRDTIEQLEYRHDVNYPCNSKSTIQGVPNISNGLGHSADMVLASITAFF